MIVSPEIRMLIYMDEFTSFLDDSFSEGINPEVERVIVIIKYSD
jgi:hypothetical protein